MRADGMGADDSETGGRLRTRGAGEGVADADDWIASASASGISGSSAFFTFSRGHFAPFLSEPGRAQYPEVRLRGDFEHWCRTAPLPAFTALMACQSPRFVRAFPRAVLIFTL